MTIFLRPVIEIKRMGNSREFTTKIVNSGKGELLFQHLATTTKLNASKRFLDKISKIDITTFLKYKYREGKTHQIELPSSLQDNVLDYYEYLEAFFFNLRSCIDSFLWEVVLYFDLGLKKLYEDKRKNIFALMKEKHPDKKITQLLISYRQLEWYKYLNPMRNQITHRYLAELIFSKEDKIHLPPNPIALDFKKPKDFTIEHKYEVIICLENLLENVLDFLENGYDFLIKES